MDIGEKFRNVRNDKGLSMRELAKMSGTTIGTLSQIENNKISPSISTLKKILDALGMTLGEFFAPTEESEPKIVTAHKDLINTASGEGIEYLTLPRGSANTGVVLMDERYQPGTSTGEEAYTHSGEETGICIKGTIELTVDNEKYVLRAGDIFSFNSERPHSWRNIGRTEARMITACSPSSF